MLFQKLYRLNNNSVIITDIWSNVEKKHKLYWSDHAAKWQHGVAIAINVDEGIDTIIRLCNVPFSTLLSLNILAHISPKINLTRETLKLITISRWHTQNLLPWQPPSKL